LRTSNEAPSSLAWVRKKGLIRLSSVVSPDRQKGDVGPDQIVVVVGEVAVDAIPQVTGEAVVEKLLVDRPGQLPGQFQVVAFAQRDARKVLDHQPEVGQQMRFACCPAEDLTGQPMDVFSDRFHLLAHPTVGANRAQVGVGDDGRDQGSWPRTSGPGQSASTPIALPPTCGCACG
jgi:hypothetical protein